MSNSTPVWLQMLSETYYLKDLILTSVFFPGTCLENESGFAVKETVVCKITVSFIEVIGNV